MNFFAAQERSRRATRFLVLFFFLAFATVALVTALVLGLVLGWYEDRMTAGPITSIESLMSTDLGIVVGVALFVLLVMVLASLYRVATLARGGGHVARMLGGTEVRSDASEPSQRRLVNVVEEMAIASGLPVPEIYVLEQEAGINAFAAGLSESDAAVAVTRGALDRLKRNELQGVIAHEFSHILNGDMRLNQRLMGFSFGILVLSLTGRWLLRSGRYTRRGRNSGAAAALALGVALTVIGGIGVMLSRLIKAAVSRQREVLADASAVQFTREPSALAGALKKIGGYTSKLSAVDDEEVAHMLFESKAHWLGRIFATHPPLIERIQTLEPSFNPDEYDWQTPAGPREPAMDSELSSGLADRQSSLQVDTLGDALEHTGQIAAPSVGGAILRGLPDELYHAAHSQASSILLVVALALAQDERTRASQRQLLQSQLGSERANLTLRLHSELMQLERRLWLPLLELAKPAIKQRPPEQLQYLAELVQRLTSLNERQRLFDFVLLRVLAGYVGRTLPRYRAAPAKLDSQRAAAHLLAVVAAYGHESSDAARAAYDAGIAALKTRSTLTPDFEPLEKARNLNILDAALARLARLTPRAKQRLLEGVAATIEHDRTTEVVEVELYRAIAAVLGCPVPPMLTSTGSDP